VLLDHQPETRRKRESHFDGCLSRDVCSAPVRGMRCSRLQLQHQGSALRRLPCVSFPCEWVTGRLSCPSDAQRTELPRRKFHHAFARRGGCRRLRFFSFSHVRRCQVLCPAFHTTVNLF
jgi:hypothetical protein